MKNIFAKFRISAALDAGKPIAPALRETAARSEDLRRFAANAEALEHALKSEQPQTETPPWLHGSIMHAVQNSAAAELKPRPAIPRGLAYFSIALLALTTVWFVLFYSQPAKREATKSLAVATQALDMGSQLTQTIPSQVIAPVSVELARVNQDLTNTAQFLLASIP